MRRSVLPLLLALVSLFLGGCWNGRLLIAAEQPWWAAEGGSALLRLPLARTALLHGYLPTFLVIGLQDDPPARISRELTARRFSAAVVSPLLSLAAQDYAPRFPATRFLLVDGPLSAPGLQNALPLSFDRTSAFSLAGRVAALSIRDEEGGSVSSALASRVGALVSAHPPGTALELEAFVQGVSQGMDGGQPVTRTFSDPLDRTMVRSAIDGMRKDGVEIFLLFLGSADAWALEDMSNSGGCAIVSGWAATEAFPNQVFLSVETDLPDGVGRFLSHGERGGAVSGRVRVVAGKARPVPAQIAVEVSAR